MPYCTRDETGWSYWLTKEDLQRIGLNPESPVLTALYPQPCAHLSAEDSREGLTCPEHPCTCGGTDAEPDRDPFTGEMIPCVVCTMSPQIGGTGLCSHCTEEDLMELCEWLSRLDDE